MMFAIVIDFQVLYTDRTSILTTYSRTFRIYVKHTHSHIHSQ